ncbi:MAG: hypothetical protein LBP19_08360 [Treponema sp.]|jgi:hypothetical protein|nr:hypothetical protein [Treponema sp.]
MEQTVTIQDIMAIIDRMARETKAMFEETGKQLKETDKQLKETGKQIKAMSRETDKQIKATNRAIGELGGRLGEMVEYIVSPHLEKKFKKLGILLKTHIEGHKIEEPGKGIIAEIDVFLTGDEYAVAVEAKVKPNQDDIDDHVERMGKLRRYADRLRDERKYIGAIAGMVVSKEVKEYAFKKGFPVLTPSGESMDIEYPKGMKPKEW